MAVLCVTFAVLGRVKPKSFVKSAKFRITSAIFAISMGISRKTSASQQKSAIVLAFFLEFFGKLV